MLQCWSRAREACRIALEFSITRDFNPDTDILYVHLTRFIEFTNLYCQMTGTGPVTKIRHLALSFPTPNLRGYPAMAAALGSLRSLQTVSIV